MIKLIAERCIGCRLCEKACLFEGIRLEKDLPVLTEQCTGCGACISVCKTGAIVRDECAPADASGLDDYSGIWVVAEQHSGEIHQVTFELLGKARLLSEHNRTSVIAVLLGHNISNRAAQLIEYGADRVFVADAPFLSPYRLIPWERIVSSLIAEHKPAIVLLGATTAGRELAPRIANRFRTGLTADCTGLEIDPESGQLLQTRPAFGGNIMATITTPRHRPQMATVRPGVMQPHPIEGHTGEITAINPQDEQADSRISIKEIIPHLQHTVSLEKSDIIISGGRGLGKPENFQLLHELAELLSGQVGASRAAVDMGWIGHEHQVGQTGKTVRPRLYIACGISGAVQHIAGMQNAEMIVAVNSDPHAPIFEFAHVAVVGNVSEVIPELVYRLKNRPAPA